MAGCDRGTVTAGEAGRAAPGGSARLRLGPDLDGPTLRFRHRGGPIGAPLDAAVLSGEHAGDVQHGQIRGRGFTGAFLGLWSWDLTGGGLPAGFDGAAYRTRP
jgi:xylan 1,4-beta-xylosidase